MIVERIGFENVACYRGRHSVALGPSVYAVTASHDANPERSNWLGKSTFLWMFPFALFGEHPYPVDDDLITRGEGKAMVALDFDTGEKVTRTKTRGKSTRLSFFDASGAEFTQAAAQAEIERLIGMGRVDFMATCFFAQKQFDRMVTARSAERLAIVESWLAEDLAPLQAMHEAALEKHWQEREAGTKARLAAEVHLGSLGDLFGKYAERAPADLLAALHADQVDVMARLKSAERVLADIASEGDKAVRAYDARTRAVNAYDAAVQSGTALKAKFDSLTVLPMGREAELDQCIAFTSDDLKAAEADLSLKEANARGEFDGTCPVTKASCPSAEWVRCAGCSPDELTKARRRVSTTANQLREVEKEKVANDRAKLERARLEGALTVARETARKAGDEADKADEVVAELKPLAEYLEATEKARAVVAELRGEGAALLKDIETTRRAFAGHDEEKKIEAQSAERVSALSEAVQLLGKAGLQQKVASGALAMVEAGANEMLASCGVSLSVTVTWSAEAQGLAKHCDVCGEPFGPGAKQKACRCGAPRGPNLVPKLGISLSDRSGAAEDLAGIAIGLSASRWLRAKRGASWGVLFLDEPFGALDAHHKRSLGAHVATLLRHSAEGAFVVAHDKGVLDALPSRVEIKTASSGTRTVSVES